MTTSTTWLFSSSSNSSKNGVSNCSVDCSLSDSSSCSFFYSRLLEIKNKVIKKIDPVHFLKSVKNKYEIENMKKSHLADGVALTKFLFWLKKNFKKRKITEISAQEKLESFRKMNASYKCPSFNTISGSGPNSAIIHYRASAKTNRALKKGEIYLVDSGGQYEFGSTDVTRTLCFTNQPRRIKNVFTQENKRWRLWRKKSYSIYVSWF